ncbi:MAG: cytochrome c3 family protein [Myxococcota bacterium]
MRSPSRRFWPAFVLSLSALLGACVTLEWQPLGPRRTQPIPDVSLVGAEECASCHEDVRGHEKIAGYHADCETCHGGGDLHSRSEETADIRYPANADCLVCHSPARNTHLSWGSGEHSRAGLLCSDCHDPHEPAKRHLRERQNLLFADIDAASGLCLSCHENVAAKLSFPSHHPVQEGAMSCLGCHDPHEDRRVSFGDRNQLCAGCHQDYVGPWPYEHAPVAEDCGLCHDPHGAVADDLLETIQPIVCIGCHTINDLVHHFEVTSTNIPGNTIGSPITAQEARTLLDRCTDCHGAIHGSYTDEYLRH